MVLSQWQTLNLTPVLMLIRFLWEKFYYRDNLEDDTSSHAEFKVQIGANQFRYVTVWSRILIGMEPEQYIFSFTNVADR